MSNFIGEGELAEDALGKLLATKPTEDKATLEHVLLVRAACALCELRTVSVAYFKAKAEHQPA